MRTEKKAPEAVTEKLRGSKKGNERVDNLSLFKN
jgi:hypothetical protein